MTTERTITAFEVAHSEGMPVEPAPVERDWMEAKNRFAYRCLPLTIANQAGWFIPNPTAFTARWNGGLESSDTIIEFGADRRDVLADQGISSWSTMDPLPQSTPELATTNETSDSRIMSHFGNGVVTFSLPYLFRTSPDVNLWIKGPTNYIKDGVQPLEGIVESDWSSSTFTMNWKITAPGRSVRFEKGEPICMIVPVPRGFVESFTPRMAALSSCQEIQQEYEAWTADRSQFLVALKDRQPEATERKWQKDYFKGQTLAGETFEGHQTHLNVRTFTRETE